MEGLIRRCAGFFGSRRGRSHCSFVTMETLGWLFGVRFLRTAGTFGCLLWNWKKLGSRVAEWRWRGSGSPLLLVASGNAIQFGIVRIAEEIVIIQFASIRAPQKIMILVIAETEDSQWLIWRFFFATLDAVQNSRIRP